MEKITIYNGDFKLRINKEVIDCLENNRGYSMTDLLEHMGYRLENSKYYSRDLEGFKEVCWDYTMEYVADGLSIFNHHIMEDFKRLQHWEIDEIVEDSGYIEYNPESGFCEFARMVLVEKETQIIYNDLENIFQYIEFILIDTDDKETVKADILYHLEMYKDNYIQGLADEYKKTNSLNCVESINEYISTINYCSYQAVGYGENKKEWYAYKYYHVSLYLDKDIQEAIKNY